MEYEKKWGVKDKEYIAEISIVFNKNDEDIQFLENVYIFQE